MKKYKILKPEVAVECYSVHSGILFYGNNRDSCGIFLRNNFLTGKQGIENHRTRVYNVTSNYCLSEENYFAIQDVEVFRIIFE